MFLPLLPERWGYWHVFFCEGTLEINAPEQPFELVGCLAEPGGFLT